MINAKEPDLLMLKSKTLNLITWSMVRDVDEYKPDNQLSQFAPPRITYGCGKLRKLAIGFVILAASVVMNRRPPATGGRKASTSIIPYRSKRLLCSLNSS